MQRQNFTKIKLSLLMLLSAAALSAEPFRVASLHTAELSADTEYSVTEKLSVNDAFAIFLPEERTYLEGIEIKMEIPEAVAQWRDCIALYFYQSISPEPAPNQIDFDGKKAYFGVLPGKLSWIIQLPFSSDNNIKSSQYITKLDPIYSDSNKFIFLRLQQVMKGIPDEVMNSVISVTVKPLLKDLGSLNLKLASAGENTEPCTIFIDDEPVQAQADLEKLLLKTGIHNVNVISEFYRTEVRTVRIDQAKTTDLEIKLKSIEPTLVITAPEGTQIFLDEEVFTQAGNEIVVTEGDHKIRFIIGDYEIARSITITRGKTFRANLAIDLQMSEEE